jgi:hypothetical protein
MKHGPDVFNHKKLIVVRYESKINGWVCTKMLVDPDVKKKVGADAFVFQISSFKKYQLPTDPYRMHLNKIFKALDKVGYGNGPRTETLGKRFCQMVIEIKNQPAPPGHLGS